LYTKKVLAVICLQRPLQLPLFECKVFDDNRGQNKKVDNAVHDTIEFKYNFSRYI
jgi:hypothetical protein